MIVGGATNRVFEFDIASNTWTEKNSATTNRYGAFGGIVNGKLYLMGGSNPEGYITVTEEGTLQ